MQQPIKNNKQQTAVDWLRIEINKRGPKENNPPEWLQELYTQAKELEKEQMDKVSEDWFVEGCSHMKDNKRIYQSFEQYYNETYNN
jgi:hypothetical protein